MSKGFAGCVSEVPTASHYFAVPHSCGTGPVGVSGRSGVPGTGSDFNSERRIDTKERGLYYVDIKDTWNFLLS